MGIFDKEKPKQTTLQDVEQKFLELQFELGKNYYMAHVRSEEANRYQDRANDIAVEMTRLASKGSELKQKIETELKQTIEKGKKNDSPHH